MSWLYDDTKTVRELRAAYYSRVKSDLWDTLQKALERAPGLTLSEVIAQESDTIYDAIHLSADQAVVYTRDAETILFVSDNDDYAADEACGEEEAKQLSIEARAAWAFIADTNDLLNNEYYLQEAAESLGVKP